MTSPAHTTFRNGSRGYLIGDDYFIGVTSLIRATLAEARSLTTWKQKRLINLALDKRAELDGIVIDREELVRLVLDAERDSGPEAALGTQVHSLIEAFENGDEITIRDADKNLLRYLDRWQRLKDDHTMDVAWTERTLVNTELGYAGTADGLFTGDAHPYRADRFLYDIKTGKNVHDTYALQLALLARCDSWLTPDGDLEPIAEADRWNTDVAFVVKLGPRSHHLHRVHLHYAWKYARLLAELYAWQTGEGALSISSSLPARGQVESKRLELLERARQLDALAKGYVTEHWESAWPKLTDADWDAGALDEVDALLAWAERGRIA